MEKEQIISRGNAALALMQDEMFNLVVQELHSQNVDNFMNSAPDDKKPREVAYYRNLALQDILGLLAQWVTLRDQTLFELENPQDE